MLRHTFLFLSLVITIFSARAETSKALPTSLREYSAQTAGRQAYGVYFQNQKSGWMIYESKLETRGEGATKKEVGVSRMQMMIALGRGKEGVSLKSTRTSYYDFQGAGALIYSEIVNEENDKTTKLTARPVADKNGKPQAGKMLMITQRDKRELARQTVSTRDTLLLTRNFHAWLLSNPKPDATFSMVQLDLEQGRDVPSDFVYKSAQTISWGGVPTEVYTVLMKSQGISASMDLRANSWPIRARLAGIMDMRAEEEAMAKKLTGAPVDLLGASLIKVDQNLGASGKVRSLKIKLGGLDEFELPISHRQKITSRDVDGITVETQRDFRIPAAAPLSAAERALHLKSTTKHPAASNAMKNLVRKIIGNERDAVKIAGLLQNWVFRNLRKTMASNANTADEVLETRAGDCTEHTLLFVALARAAGIPAREVGGIMYAGDGSRLFGWHAWAQIHDGHQWVSVDPTWDQVYVDATHIVFSYGDEDWSWVNVLGTLKLHVVSFEKN